MSHLLTAPTLANGMWDHVEAACDTADQHKSSVSPHCHISRHMVVNEHQDDVRDQQNGACERLQHRGQWCWAAQSVQKACAFADCNCATDLICQIGQQCAPIVSKYVSATHVVDNILSAGAESRRCSSSALPMWSTARRNRRRSSKPALHRLTLALLARIIGANRQLAPEHKASFHSVDYFDRLRRCLLDSLSSWNHGVSSMLDMSTNFVCRTACTEVPAACHERASHIVSGCHRSCCLQSEAGHINCNPLCQPTL